MWSTSIARYRRGARRRPLAGPRCRWPTSSPDHRGRNRSRGPSDSLAYLRRRWLTILACLLAGILVAIAVTRSSPKRYASATRLFVNIPVAQDVTQALQGVQLSQQLIASYAQIATSQTAENQIAQRL